MADLAIANPETESQEIDFVIGDVVDVTRRMWPGVNKPGGVGRITKIRYNEENNSYLYDVAYVLGARETKIEPRFISLLNDDGTRKRSTVGRCRFCKSFFRDCGHDQDVDPFEEPSAEQPATTPTAQSAQKKPAVTKSKEPRSGGEPKVRRFNGVSNKLSEDPTANVSPSETKSRDDYVNGYHSESDGEPNTTMDEESERDRPVTPHDSTKKDKKRRRSDWSNTPSTGSSIFFSTPIMAPTPPPPAPTLRKKKIIVEQTRPGSNYYGLSRLDQTNRDIAYNSLILDMHNTNKVVRLIENLNCIKRFTVHGEEQSTQYSLIC